MMRSCGTLAGALALLATATAAAAGPPVDGVFEARQACPAVRSIRSGANPGDVRTAPGTRYRALELNRPGGDHLRVEVPGAPQLTARWVPLSCGTLQERDAARGAAEAPPRHDPPELRAGAGAASTSNVLAVSWQSAFCEIAPRRGECRALARGRIGAAAARFSIHGLWPDAGEYCGPAGAAARDARRWSDLPPVPLRRATVSALAPLMPGMLSHLERHEWYSHGTCYNADADEYFADTVALVEALNASPVRAAMLDNVGRTIDTAVIGAAFDAAFGPGARRRVTFECDRDPDSGRTVLVELRIALRGEITADPDLGALIRAAPTRGHGCRRATIDPPGPQ
ncbi:ribonuclease [Acuticoccus sp. I52.16.1]|uniref:ribonuclease T2 family protein n=1 Tax=Acuticoccus sp. I52.16.1 TaxID=2928472 RepID=UPI001FD21B78|nr:ribonuclease [Acuticoccus sp. I52.16.1]UOM34183.1 ribonuclease [Acuticoccus sp. I52.16.1]